uniref:DOCKER domain-containing protein n=1 Tax=Spongospora subterranea TaxID=70186 RepID=A0A0H5QLW0_9EUKA|eukprot:CRZ03003.1 hypothetical protein [Spongospora subterranea]
MARQPAPSSPVREYSTKPCLPLPSLISLPTPNRFTGDFVPSVPPVSSPLVLHALDELVRPRLNVINAPVDPYVPALVQTVHHRHTIDDGHLDIAQSPSSHSPSRPALVDLFTRAPSDQIQSTTLREKRAQIQMSQTTATTQIDKSRTDDLHVLDASALLLDELYSPIELNTACQFGKTLYENAVSALWRYDPDWQCPDSLEKSDCSRYHVPMWGDGPQTHSAPLFCSIQRLTMCVGALEPFFCSLAIYDLRPNGGRISENFYFDLNSEDVLTSGLSVWRLAADEITLCRNALFTIPDRHPLVVLVLRIERILQGDPEEAFEPYLKEKGRAPNELDKISKRVRTTINRLSEYRQSFGVSVIPLFSDTGDLLHDTPTVLSQHIFIEKQAVDEVTFLEQLREYNLPSQDLPINLKKKLLPNVEFAAELYLLDGKRMPLNCVDPSLIPLKAPSNVWDHAVQGPVREVQYFPLYSEPVTQPIAHFVNSLYVYPLRVQFQKYRNIACKVEIRLSDAALDSDGVKTFFGKSSQSAFCASQTTQVVYHNKSPFMLDEMKIMLPLSMSEFVHIFFTFYHISCQKKLGKPTEEVIGYSIFPLFKGNMLASDGIYSLAIAARLPDHYISKFEARAENANIHFRMQTADCFQIRLRSVSCLFCTDSNLNSFIALLPVLSSDDDVDDSRFGQFDTHQCLDRMRNCAISSLVQYLPAIMSFLFNRMGSFRSCRLQYTCFCALDIVVHQIRQHSDDGTFRSSLVSAFVQHSLRDDCCAIRLASMLKLGLQHLEEEEFEAKRHLVVRNLWFWLDCFVKVAGLELLRNCLSTQEMYTTLFHVFGLLASRMSTHRSPLGISALRTANSCIALFFMDLFNLFDKDLVISLITHYIESIDASKDSVLVEFKSRFLEIVFDSPSISRITGILQETSSSPVSINGIFQLYPLQSLLIHFIEMHCDFPEASIRAAIFKSLRKICTKLDRDAALSRSQRSRLAVSFLPLVQSIGDRVAIIKEMNDKSQRDLLAVIVWIINLLPDHQLSLWIKEEDIEILTGVDQLLCLSLQRFDYVGISGRTQAEFDSIVAPESCFSLFGVDSGGGGIDLKSNIEALMGTLTRGVAGPGLNVPSSGSKSRGSWASPSRSQGNTIISTPSNGSVKLSLRQKRAQMAAHGSLRRTVDKSGAKMNETVSGREGLDLVKRLCEFESGMTEVVGTVSLRWIISCIGSRWPDNAAVSPKSSTDHMPDGQLNFCNRIVQLISTIFSCQQPIHIHVALYPLLRHLLFACGPVILRSHSLSDLIKRILVHCTSSSVDIRANAASTLYWVAGADLASNGTLKLFLSAVTSSLSSMVEIMSSESAQRLSQAFRSIPSSAIPGLNQVITQLLAILADTREIARQERLLQEEAADCALYEDLLVGMAQAYSHIPSIRIQWLQRLADHCNKRAKYAEAAQSLLAISVMIIEMHSQRELTEPSNVTLPPSVLCIDCDASITQLSKWNCPGYATKTHAFNNLQLIESDQEGVSLFDRFIRILLAACHALDRAQLYERCSQVYRNVVLPILERHQDFSALSTAHLHLHSVYSQLVSSNASGNRLFGSYYRITFIGDKAVFGTGSDEGKQYIYKMPKITRLAEVVDYMKTSYGQQLGHGQIIRIWPDSGPIDRSKIAPNENVIQVTYVQPVPEDPTASSFLDKNTNVNKFMFSTPFTVGDAGTGHAADVTMQQKRNTVLTVAKTFPTLVTRQSIVDIHEVILSPVQSATENIAMRVTKLQDVIDEKDDIDKKVLTSLLQGSVMLQVHGGTKEIALAFFGPESTFAANAALSQDQQLNNELELLKQTISEFMDVCEHGIEVYGAIIEREAKDSASQDNLSSADRVLQSEFDKHLRKLRADIMPLIKSPKSRNRREVRFQAPGVHCDADE